jgi:hypothetical protein
MAGLVTQTSVETLGIATDQDGRVTQTARETLGIPTDQDGRASQVTRETLGIPTDQDGRVTQVVMEVLISSAAPPPPPPAGLPLGELEVHSIRRLNDSTPGATQPATHIVGGGTKLYYRDPAGIYTEIDSGYSGDPLSLCHYRPDAALAPYMYVGDRTRLRKTDVGGRDVGIGIAPPLLPPVTELGNFDPLIVGFFGATELWATGGTAAGLSSPSRVPAATTVAQVVGDVAIPGWISVVPTNATADYAFLGVGAEFAIQGQQILVEEIHKTEASLVDSIKYDSGSTGLCTIMPTKWFASYRRNALISVNGETVRILSVTDGPTKQPCFRVSTAGTAAAGHVIGGFVSFRGRVNTPVLVGDAITGECKEFTLTGAGTGHLTRTATIDLTTAGGGRAYTPDDYIHLSLKLNDPTKLIEARLLFDVDTVTNDFTKNYFYRAFRPNDLTQAVVGNRTNFDATAEAVHKGLIESAAVEVPYVSPFSGEQIMEDGDSIEDAPPETLPDYSGAVSTQASDQTATGSGQWSEFRFRIAELIRVGADTSRDLSNVKAIRIVLTVSGDVTVQADSLTVSGAFGPDVGTQGTPMYYRYRYRASSTGAKSLPSPMTRHGVLPIRTRVDVFTVASADPQVDKIDVERFGGVLNEWHYIGTIPNVGDGILIDDKASAFIQINPPLETDAYQPFPIIDSPKSGTCSVVGTAVTRLSGDLFNIKWARGTELVINGTKVTLYAQPTSTSLLHINESLGTLSSVSFEIPEAVVLGQPLAVMWGPSPEGVLFAAGDPNLPGWIYPTKGNDPDSAPESYKFEVTSPSEVLMNGGMYGEIPFVFSNERLFKLHPTFDQTNKWRAQMVPGSKGLFSRWAFCVGGSKIWFLSKDGIYETDGGSFVSITDEDLYPLFPHDGQPGESVNGITPPNFSLTTKLRLSYADGSLYFNYIGTDAQHYTLVYDTRVRGWLLDKYGKDVLFHYDEEGPGVHRIIVLAKNGFIYYLGGTTDDSVAIPGQVRTGAYDAGDPRTGKTWGDLKLDFDNPSAVSITTTPGFDRRSATQAPSVITSSDLPIDINAGAGRFAKNMDLDLAWSTSATPPTLYSWQPAFLNQPEKVYRRATDWDDDGYVGAKFVQGYILTADTENLSRNLQTQYDAAQIGETLATQHNGQQTKAYSFQVPFVGHEMRLLPTDADSEQIKIFKVRWIWEPAPDLALNWITQPTTHDFVGFWHHWRGMVPHQSTADVSLILNVEGVDQPAIIIPHGGGIYAKSQIIFPPKKCKLVSYKATSTQPFRLFLKDLEIMAKPWGSSGGYSVLRPFGDIHRVGGARI